MRDADKPSAEEIQALIDGELSPEDAARVRSMLACSPDAMLELDECLQMAALAHVLRVEARALDSASGSHIQDGNAKAVDIIPLAGRVPRVRRPKTIMRMVAAMSLAGAAAAVIATATLTGDGDVGNGHQLAAIEPAAEFAGALAPRRPMAARLSWPGADRYRPYDTARAGEAGERSAESLSFELLGRVEKLGDPRAMTAARILRGDMTQARRELALDKRTPDADSDRAAIALIEGKSEDALVAAAAAAESDPQHVQATWNRALALERLGMPLTAADAFEAVAARGEPGWSQEASERATTLRAQFQRRRSAWEAANAAGAQLVAGSPDRSAVRAAAARAVMDDATLSAYPSLMRRYLYEAVRTADSAARVKALRPVAAALDSHYGGSHLTGYVDRIARSDFRRRAPLATRYAVLARHEMKDPSAVQAVLRDLRAAGQKDILLGALVHAGNNPDRPEEPELDEYLALAKATSDPWFALEAADHRAWVALRKDDVLRAQTLLSAAEAICNGAAAIDYLCIDVFRLSTHAFQDLHRPDAARRTLDRALSIARASGNVAHETQLLWYAHWIAALRDDTSSSLMALSAAYLDEFTHQSDDCADARDAREWKAVELINRHRLDDARELMLNHTDECDAPFTTGRAFVLAHLLNRPGDDAAVHALQRNIAELRLSEGSAGERAFLDHTEGRLLVTRSPAEGRALLRRAIAAAAELPAEDSNAARARAYSYSVLIEDAGARGAAGDVFDLLAEEIGAAAPARCALGASLESSPVFVARAADGTATLFRAPRAPGEPAGARAVPASMQASFAGCQSVDVFARQPYYGRPDLLPRDVAWQFRTRGSTREVTPRPGRQVVVANIDPPRALDLAPLRRLADAPGATLIEGASATPERVMAAAADASLLEIHAHGLPGGAESDTSLLVLAPDTRGRYALGGAEIRRARLRGAPVVVLAACHASAIGDAFHSTWGLADAFVEAGARAVIASPDPIQDANASAFFAALRARIAAGEPPAAALRAERLERKNLSEQSWIDRLVVFR